MQPVPPQVDHVAKGDLSNPFQDHRAMMEQVSIDSGRSIEAGAVQVFRARFGAHLGHLLHEYRLYRACRMATVR